MITELGFQEFAALYQTHLTRDFPANERRPLAVLKSLYQKKRYTCLVLQEKGNLIAYGSFLFDAHLSSVLMDHFAVIPERRGGGTGSRFLHELQAHWDRDGIIIESELPEKAKSPEDRLIRERRIAFYERNGAALSPFGWRLFSVDFNLLWLPIKKELPEVDICTEIQSLYALHGPEALLQLATKLYKL